MSDLEFLGFANDVSTLDPIMYQYFNQLLKKRTIILNAEIDEITGYVEPVQQGGNG